jgi:membrane protein
LWIQREAGYYSAAFSYYAPLALIPLLLFSVAVVGFFYGESFTGDVFESWGAVLGTELVEIIKSAFQNLASVNGSIGIPFVGTFFFLGFCLIALNIISDGFHKLWGIESGGARNFMIKSLRSLAFIIILQAYLIVVIGVEFFIIPTFFGPGSPISSLILFFATLVFFASIYKGLSSTSPSWKACWVGSIASSILFILIKSIVDFYIATTPVLTVYGGAGLILILLVWVYVFAALIFYGAAVAGLYGKMQTNL